MTKTVKILLVLLVVAALGVGAYFAQEGGYFQGYSRLGKSTKETTQPVEKESKKIPKVPKNSEEPKISTTPSVTETAPADTESAPTIVCVDSDNGKDYHVKGTLVGEMPQPGNTTYHLNSSDSCTSDTRLSEYYCYVQDGVNYGTWETYNCENEGATCNDGRCVVSVPLTLDLSLSSDASSFEDTLVSGTTNVPLLSVEFEAGGENVYISELRFQTSNDSVIQSAKLYKGNVQVGSARLPQNGEVYFNVASTIQAGSSATFTLKADLTGSGEVYAYLKDASKINAWGQPSENAVIANGNFPFLGGTVSVVEQGTLTTQVSGGGDVNIGNHVALMELRFTADDEDINIEELKFTLTSNGTLGNFIQSVSLDDDQAFLSNGNAYFSNLDFLVRKGETRRIVLYADQLMNGGASSNDMISIQLNSISATGMSSASTITSESTSLQTVIRF